MTPINRILIVILLFFTIQPDVVAQFSFTQKNLSEQPLVYSASDYLKNSALKQGIAFALPYAAVIVVVFATPLGLTLTGAYVIAGIIGITAFGFQLGSIIDLHRAGVAIGKLERKMS